MTRTLQITVILLMLSTAITLVPDVASASITTSDILDGSTNPIKKFMDFLTGGFAVALAIIGIISFGAMVMFGQNFEGLGRRIPLLIIGLALILGATGVVTRISTSDGMIIMPVAPPYERIE